VRVLKVQGEFIQTTESSGDKLKFSLIFIITLFLVTK
jgi:hypothetical protein